MIVTLNHSVTEKKGKTNEVLQKRTKNNTFRGKKKHLMYRIQAPLISLACT